MKSEVELYRSLSPAEARVFHGLLEDIPLKDLSVRLGIAYNTSHVHRRNIFRKLGVQTPIGLVRFAMRAGVIRQ